MKKIAELLSRDLSRRIEEVIQVDQAEELAVFAEIDEYIATDSIRDQYAHLLKAIAEAPSDPNEAIGVWVSGFFGSGKSSWAKNLGYALQNNKVVGQDFSALFKRQIKDTRVSDLLDLINARFATEVIFFDIAKEQDTRRVTQRISEFLYVVLLRHLDYAEDFDIAELEIELEAEGKLDDFIKTCKKLHKQDWKMIRKGAQRISRASAVLHEIDPKTYTTADSWTQSQRNRDTSITLTKVVERCFELVTRRRPGKALVWVIDEVGQHVARSDDKIEDLRAVVQEFGLVGRNLVKAKKLSAPAWMIVTSQEKLEEVVSALDSKRVQLAKLQDRFRHRVDLAPSDIREVATKRVLAKKDKAEPILKKLFGENQGQLNDAIKLERTTRKTEITEADFVQFYPYPPHYIDLCISIVSGLRLQPGAPKQYGGSNRTIIKQAYEMLVSERTDMKSRPIGCMVTLDKVYELVEGNLTTEKRTDIHDISQRFKTDTEDQGWTLRTAKVICLLEFVRDLPRTEPNIASFLVDEVGKPAPIAQVQAAIKKLHAAQFIRNTDEGWKLQTAQEKNWDTERKTYLDPKQREQNEIARQVLREVFGEPSLKTYKFRDIRTFRIGVTHDGTQVGDDGDLTVTLGMADDNDDLPKKLKEVREERIGPRPLRRKPARFSASRNFGTTSASRGRAVSGTIMYPATPRAVARHRSTGCCNTNQPVEVMVRSSHLFVPMPDVIREDMAFLDRLHFYIPGWEVPKMRVEFFTDHYGFVVDYLAEALRELRKHNFTEIIDRHFSLGSHLNARDVKAVRKTCSGLVKLIFPHGEVSKDELVELLSIALEGRRRVKEQLKKMGSFEYHQTSFSYLDNETREERFVGVPEQGGRDMISTDPLAPGSVYTVSVDDQGKVGLYRIEVGCSPGTGKLKIAGGIEGPMKESIQRAFAYLMGQKVKMGVAQQIDTTDFHVEAIDLLNNRVPCEAGIALVVAVYSAVKRHSVLAGLLVLGDLSIQGNIKSVRSLAEPLQVGMDNGARRALVPLENKRNFLDVSGDIVERVDPVFFSDPMTAAMKALGMT